MTFHLYLSDYNNNNLKVFCKYVSRLVSRVEQDLLMLPGHLLSYRVLCFLCCVLYSCASPFGRFQAMALSVCFQPTSLIGPLPLFGDQYNISTIKREVTSILDLKMRQ